MTTVEPWVREKTEITSRAKRLKAATHDTHDRLDRKIMAADPFASIERYGWFLDVQYRFHHGIDPLYRNHDLAAIIPDLESRRRLDLIRQDLLDIEAPMPAPPASEDDLIDVPNSLGWLYVAEGSNLGAAFLLKEAARLGLSENFGARHLAAAPEGRGLQWRTFTAALDRIDLSEEAEERAIEGAGQAFARVNQLVADRFYPDGEAAPRADF
ncbi:heme oxygenase [Brucella endophytica]|uniref:Heme oxygenase n=1 Tax=Brucella endophytica TaxID=1963359 RepID=A0A916S865_9HYPH|nr:biliverdin-producing heme oxygenase [Brucella endophytica]GGA87697.1 heme oxygenase [Brucella endophytica]